MKACKSRFNSGPELTTAEALKEATKLNNYRDLPETVFTVLCGEKQARVLLDIAKEHCPQAVHETEFPIQSSRAQPVCRPLARRAPMFFNIL